MEQFDKQDRAILRLLQSEADISAAEVAERVGTSQATCWRRIQKLRESGVIPPQVVRLNRKAIGYNAMVFAQVKLTSQGRGNLAEFSSKIREFPEVLDCYVLMGTVDFLLRIVTVDTDAYERFFFKKLATLPGVQEITSSIALSEIKHTTVLEI